MNKTKYLLLALVLGFLSISFISADEYSFFEKGTPVNITGILCLNMDNTPCATTVGCYITMVNATDNVEVSNALMTPYADGKRSYFYGFYLTDGNHNWSIATRDNSNNYNIQTATFTIGACPSCQAYQEINGSLVVYANKTLVIKAC